MKEVTVPPSCKWCGHTIIVHMSKGDSSTPDRCLACKCPRYTLVEKRERKSA